MSYIFAGTSYRNEHEAQIDQIHEWITATGSTQTVKALTSYWDNPDHLTDELERDHRAGDWVIPGLDTECDRSDIVDLLEDWEEWARGHAIRQARDDMGIDQEDMAGMLRLGSYNRVSEYENHRVTPSKQTILLAGAYREIMSMRDEGDDSLYREYSDKSHGWDGYYSLGPITIFVATDGTFHMHRGEA